MISKSETVRYPIVDVEVGIIPENAILKTDITIKDKELCRDNILKYGLLKPIVVIEKENGELVTIDGENELEILKEMKVKSTQVFLAKAQGKEDKEKLTMTLAMMQKKFNPVAEGFFLREIINLSGCTQKDLADNLRKSKSWVCKRLSLIDNLNEKVIELVFKKVLNPSCAQEISKLPKNLQFGFAEKVCENNIAKNIVANLVRAYNMSSVPQTAKDLIINRPMYARNYIDNMFKDIKKIKNSKKDKDVNKPYEYNINISSSIMIKQINEITLVLSEDINNDTRKKYMWTIKALTKEMINFVRFTDKIYSQEKNTGFNNNVEINKEVSLGKQKGANQ